MSVYCIKDQKNEVVYIGISNNPQRRFQKEHCKYVSFLQGNAPDLYKYLATQQEFHMEELYQGDDYKEKEKEYIRYYKEQGQTLFNVYHNSLKRRKIHNFTIQEEEIDSEEDDFR